jgi:hypothetical protein
MRVHQLDGETYTAVNEARAGEFKLRVAPEVRVAAQEMYECVFDECANDKSLPGLFFLKLEGEFACETREAFVSFDGACAEGDDVVCACESRAGGAVEDEDGREVDEDVLDARQARGAQGVSGRGEESRAFGDFARLHGFA